MQFTDLPQNTSGVLYQNDSPRHFWSRFRLGGGLVPGRARAQPVIFNSYPNPATKRLLGLSSTGSRTYLIAPGHASKLTPRMAAKSDSMC